MNSVYYSWQIEDLFCDFSVTLEAQFYNLILTQITGIEILSGQDFLFHSFCWMDLSMVKHVEWYSEYYTVQQHFSAHIKNKQM